MMRILSARFVFITNLIIIAGLYPGFSQSAKTPESWKNPSSFYAGQTRHQEITHLAEIDSGPRFVERRVPDYDQPEATILFTLNETNLGKGPDFSNTLRGNFPAPSFSPKQVSIAFAHEGWSVLHPLSYTKSPDPSGRVQTIFFLYYDLSSSAHKKILADSGFLAYRFIVDGLWMADPVNSLSDRRVNGALISLVDLRSAPPPPVMSPEIEIPQAQPLNASVNSKELSRLSLADSRKTRTVRLKFVGEPGLEIYALGTFNNFEPYMHRLTPRSPDPRRPQLTVYEIELKLLAGQYFYNFLIDGESILDQLNTKKGYSPEGILYSLCIVP